VRASTAASWQVRLATAAISRSVHEDWPRGMRTLSSVVTSRDSIEPEDVVKKPAARAA
jgi:hypothetical protein